MRHPSRPAWLPVCCLAAFLLAGSWRTAAPENGDEPDGAETALIDMAEVFRRSDRFRAERARLRSEIEAEGADLKPLYDKLLELTEDLKTLEEGTEQHAWAKREHETVSKDYKAGHEALSKKFLRQEAGVYQELYEEVQSIVAEIAGERGVRLVIRHSRKKDAGDGLTDPAEQLKAMNQLIVHSRLPDLTDEVADRFND